MMGGALFSALYFMKPSKFEVVNGLSYKWRVRIEPGLTNDEKALLQRTMAVSNIPYRIESASEQATTVSFTADSPITETFKKDDELAFLSALIPEHSVYLLSASKA